MDELSPKNLPKGKEPYRLIQNGKNIYVHPNTVSYAPFGFDDPLHSEFIKPLTSILEANPSVPDQYIDLFRKYSFLLLKHNPDSLGIIRKADFSGPGATSLMNTLSHKTRGYAFVAEIITAGLLHEKPMAINHDSNLPLHPLRVDLGFKFLNKTGNRKTIEADVLLQTEDGKTFAIDVKHSLKHAYKSPLGQKHLQAIESVLKGGAIDGFLFVTNGRFSKSFQNCVHRSKSPRISFVENYWP